MSNVSNLTSPSILNRGLNSWPSGNTITLVAPIISDIQALALALDNIEAGAITLTTVEAGDGTVSLPSFTFASDLDNGMYRIGANNYGFAANGAKVLDIGTTGLGITGLLTTTTSAAVGTALTVGTDVTLAREVNHNISVATTTTAATVGGTIALTGGQGATSGNGGPANLIGGAGGVTGAGGVASVTSGAGGATSGASGAVNISSGAATIGSSGTITLTSGNTASGVAGDVTLTTGTHTSTTVVPCVTTSKAHVRKPSTKSIASGGTLTGPELLGGYIEVTGATGNVTLPDTTAITTAIGSTPAGTSFEFVVNAVGMTATNVATLVVGANMTVQKQTSDGDSAVAQLLTVTQTAGTNIGVFKIVFISSTTTSIHRIA